MKKIATLLILVSILVLACKKEQSKSENSTPVKETIPELQKENAIPTKEKGYKKEHQANTYTLIIESNNEEISTVKIYSKGLKREFNESITIEGQVLDSYITDLNNNGFNEYFITISPTDDSGNINIIGFASNGGKSISEVYVKEPSEYRDTNTDKVTINKTSIRREFTVKGKKHQYNYKLIAGEAGYKLQPEIK